MGFNGRQAGTAAQLAALEEEEAGEVDQPVETLRSPPDRLDVRGTLAVNRPTICQSHQDKNPLPLTALQPGVIQSMVARLPTVATKLGVA